MKSLLSALLVTVSGGVLAQPVASVDALLAQTEPSVIEWRRHVHENAELGFQEVKTAAYVAEILRKMPGMEVQTGIAKTGVKAILKGRGPGSVIALRADMDALPVLEKNDLAFRSKAMGLIAGKQVPVMHACGHDTHVAMLLGAATILSKIRDQFDGTIVFIFQPAEEGGGGAFQMVREGVMENPKVEAVFGQHIGAGFPSGSISYRPGGAMASADTFEVQVIGKGGHGASPWTARDPILAASQMIVALQSAIARDMDMTQGGAAMTIGQFNGGTRKNVIPEDANFSGTIRTLSPGNRETLGKSLERIINGTAQTHDVKARIAYEQIYPVTFNDPVLTAASIASLNKAAGIEKVKVVEPRMGSEDFGAYTKNGSIPAFFWFLNASPFSDKPGAPNHSPLFDIDESAMKVGVAAFVNVALDYMNRRTTTSSVK